MSANQDLTKAWIRFLKTNQIAAMQSDPKTGRISYRRQVTVPDLMRFLHLKTDFDEDTAEAAIKQVLSSPDTGDDDQQIPDGANVPSVSRPQSQPQNLSTWHHSEVTPGTPQQNNVPLQPQERPKKYSNDDAEDATYRTADPKKEPQRQIGTNPSAPQLPAPVAKRKPRFKLRNPVQEAIYDHTGAALSERQVQEVFKILLAPKPKGTPAATTAPGANPAAAQGQKEEQLRKLKRVIRDTLTDDQRKQLWRALTDV